MSDIYITPYTFDQTTRLYGELRTKELAQDPALDYRMKTGIELIYPAETRTELDSVYANWQLMTDEMKEKSDAESMRLFGKTNQEHYEELIEMHEQVTILNERVNKVCTKCGSHNVGIFIQGEPIYKCKDCGKYLGTVPFPDKKKKKKTNESFIIEGVKYTNSFEDVKQILDTLSKQELLYLSDYEYTDSPYTIYRQVMNINNIPIAFAEIYRFGEESDIGVVMIACRSGSKYRHHGYASILLEDIIEWAHSNPDINKLWYMVNPKNINSINMAIKFGFEERKRTKDKIDFILDVSRSLQEQFEIIEINEDEIDSIGAVSEAVAKNKYHDNIGYGNSNVKEKYNTMDAFVDDFKRCILCTEIFALANHTIYTVKGIPVSTKITAFGRYHNDIVKIIAIAGLLPNYSVIKCRFINIKVIGPKKENDIETLYQIMRNECKNNRIYNLTFTNNNIKISLFIPDKTVCEKVSKKYKNHIKIGTLKNSITIKNKSKAVKESSEILEENTLFSGKDLEFNTDQWKIGGKNILFITGLSGSGKSTLTSRLAKENNAVRIELDLIQRNHIVFDNSLKQDEGNLIVKEYMEKKFGGAKKFIKIGTEVPKAMYDFIKYCMNYATKHKDKLFILEGIQLMDLEMNDELKGHPVIVVNSSIMKSMFRAAKREGIKDYTSQFHNFKDFMDLVTWYRLADMNKDKFIKDMNEAYKDLNNTRKFDSNKNCNNSMIESVLTEDFEINIKSDHIKPVEKLYRQLAEYKYGMVVDGVILTGDKMNFDLYRGLTIKQFEYYKTGVCWEFARYQEYYLKKYYKWVQNFYFIIDKKSDYPTHTITVFMINGSFYYIELAWEAHRGIYKSDSLQGILTQTLQWIREYYKCNKSVKYEIRRYTDNGNLAGMNCEQFMNYMNRRPKVNLEVDLTVDKIAEQETLELPNIEEPIQEEAKRSELPDDQFGIPEDRKYPLDTEDHIRSAIKLFGHAEESKKYMLAKRIKNAADNNGIEIPDNTQLFKYLYPVKKESFCTHTAQDYDIEQLKELVRRTSGTILREGVDTIIFDFGAVLVEDEGSEMFKRISEISDRSEEIYKLVGNILFKKHHNELTHAGLKLVYDIIYNEFPEDLKSYTDDILKCIGDGLHLKSTTIPLLEKLNEKGYKLYYLSNWDRWSYQLQYSVFQELVSYFDGGIFSFDTEYEKPQEEIYKLLLSKYDIDSNKAIFFDDRADNIQASINVGIDGVLFNDSTARLLLKELQLTVNEWAMNSCNPLSGIKTIKPYVLKVSDEDTSNSTVSTKFFAFSPDIISDKYLVVNENAQLEVIDADKIKNCYIEQYEYVGNKENLRKLEKAYIEGKIVDSMFIYTILSGKAMLSEDQIDFDNSFIKYNTELYEERINTIQETMKNEYNRLSGVVITEMYAFNKPIEFSDIEKKYRGIVELMQDVDGYFFYNKENKYRSRSVPFVEQLTEAMALSVL